MDARTLTLTQSFANAAARRGSAFRAKFLHACDGMPYRELSALVEQEYRGIPFLRTLPAKLFDFYIFRLFQCSVTSERVGGTERGWASRAAVGSAISRPV